MLVSVLAQVVIVLVAVRAATDLIVHRDRLRADMLLVVGTLAVPVLLRSLAPDHMLLALFALGLLLLHPLAVMRLAAATGLVPPQLRLGLKLAAGLSLGAVGTAALMDGTIYESIPVALFVAGDALASGVLIAAASRRAGLSRLRLAALGSASTAVGAAVLVAAATPHIAAVAGLGGPLAAVVFALATLGYWLGIAPPRPLRRHIRLHQLEQHLAGALTHGPGDAQAILHHLRRTVLRVTGAEHAALVLRAAPDGRFIMWSTPSNDGQATMDAGEAEATEVEVEGIWEDTWARGSPVLVQRTEVSDPISNELFRQSTADALLVVPFRSATQRWGAIGVAYAGRPLFADEDAHVLAIVGRDAALLLDHAQATFRQSQLVEQLAVERRDLVRSNRELEAFAYTISHDLKAPLIAQRWLVDQLDHTLPETTDPEARDTLASLRRSIDRMSGLTQDVLALARIGTEADDSEPIDLAQVADDVATDLRAVAEHAGTHVSVDVDTLPVARGSTTRYQQVLSNLISNAIAYGRAENGRVVVRGRIVEVPAGHVWRVEVADNGPGVPVEETERIFGLGERGSSARGENGSGMGLAIARKIAHKYGGDLMVGRSDMGGAAFWLDLPVYSRIDRQASAGRAPTRDPLLTPASSRVIGVDALFEA